MKNREKLFLELTTKRGIWCEVCNRAPAVEMHHAIIRQKKGHPEFDVPENLELVCRRCHDHGNLDSYEHSVEFWRKQKLRGFDMDKWHKSLNLKSKEYYE